ncbi:hypothetical protein SteCoe_5630 [Stentor coeruleus]|uniref:Uncharacterized protein n=1 Tax=Stentor coeruleus TaxID=5963 RepID=A0A1R2CRU6_9CILI|nr:hypothetical protein SteCoe_5630 [Stentor coeruleus]
MDINEILDCMALLRIPIKKSSALWKKLLNCIDTSAFLLNKLAAGLGSDLENFSMSKVEMIDEYTTDLEGYVAQEFVLAIIMSGKVLNKKLRIIIDGFSKPTGGYEEFRISDCLKSCSKFRRFLTKNKQFVESQPEYSRMLYRFLKHEDTLRKKHQTTNA